MRLFTKEQLENIKAPSKTEIEQFEAEVASKFDPNHKIAVLTDAGHSEVIPEEKKAEEDPAIERIEHELAEELASIVQEKTNRSMSLNSRDNSILV